jgi:hypothetical protein
MLNAHTGIGFGNGHMQVNVSGRRDVSRSRSPMIYRKEDYMKTFLITTMSCSLLGLLLAAGTNVAPAVAKEKSASSRYECFTDDGYGRKLPCSYGYKLQKRADGNYDCFTDDGYGRKLTCSYRIKR